MRQLFPEFCGLQCCLSTTTVGENHHPNRVTSMPEELNYRFVSEAIANLAFPGFVSYECTPVAVSCARAWADGGAVASIDTEPVQGYS
jgi:hypothetical protein